MNKIYEAFKASTDPIARRKLIVEGHETIADVFVTACQLVMDDCPNGYAKAYAKAGLELMAEPSVSDKAISIQCLYILNNLHYWRGHDAKIVRELFKAIVKELQS